MSAISKITIPKVEGLSMALENDARLARLQGFSYKRQAARKG